jgi:hypothetical protein
MPVIGYLVQLQVHLAGCANEMNEHNCAVARFVPSPVGGLGRGCLELLAVAISARVQMQWFSKSQIPSRGILNLASHIFTQ